MRVKTLEARYPSHGGSVDSPRTDEDGASFSSAAGAPIPVPPELLPVLAVLRQHIGELTRENAALRYTFLGARADLASSSRVTLDAMLTPGSSAANTPIPTDSPHSPPIGIEVTPPADPAPPPVGLGLTPIIPQVPIPTMSVGTVVPAVVVPPAAAGSKDVDLYAVVERVRTLMLENEELGDMVAEAGAADGDQWVQTLEDTKAVIASLE